MPDVTVVLAVDLGKSRCRAVLLDPERTVVHDGVGSPGLSARGGVEAARAAILPAIESLRSSPSVVSVGAAGAWAAPEAAAELARELVAAAGTRAVVASDVVAAHAGALGGREGALLIAGTGAAALGIDARGARLHDGWGPELGDLGSGSWFGREALRAVLHASAGTGEDTALTGLLRTTVGEPDGIPQWMSGDEPLARRLASLAPLVLQAAESADAVASGIASEAVRLLTRSAVSASSHSGTVALHGGLTDHAWFRAELETSLRRAGLAVAPTLGDALDGARLLAERTDLPHERFVHRAD